MSRPSSVTDFNDHPRMLPLGRIRCGPVDTPDSVKRPSLSTRALACGPNAVWSCDVNSTDCKFNFNYTAAKHQELEFRHWQDKGKGAGTSLKEEIHGDIADA